MDKNFTQSDGVSLKEHLEKLLLAQHDYFGARLDAIEKGIVVAKEAQEVRLEGMNEFRRDIEKLNTTFVPKGEWRPIIERFTADIDELKAFKNQMTGKADQSAVYIAYAISVLGIVIGIINLLTY